MGLTKGRVTELRVENARLQTAYEAMRQERDEARADAQDWLLCMDGIKHDPRCSNHFMGNPRNGPCLRCKADQLQAAEATVARLRDALEVIHKTTRGDEKSECWTIRKWLDKRGVFNDDIQGVRRLVEAACAWALTASPPRTEETSKSYGADPDERAFKAGYHCRWHREQGGYCFDPAMSPGDPDGAFAAWKCHLAELPKTPKPVPQPEGGER